MRDPRYDVLFEPVNIGPVTAKNRFYQVPHCNGGGYRDPSAAAEMRGIKAQGGWGVIFTEQCEMHQSSEITPFIELRLWDDDDIPMLAKMAGRMKEHGALAGIQLAYSGINVVVFDDDHYYMGGVLAELLVQQGASVTLVTPAAYVSEWTINTLEQAEIHRRLVEMGVEIVLNRAVATVEAGGVTTECTFSGRQSELACDAVVLVASRSPVDEVWQELKLRENEWADNGIKSIKILGDAEAPGPIAWATYAGHRYARELDTPDCGDALSFRREIIALRD